MSTNGTSSSPGRAAAGLSAVLLPDQTSSLQGGRPDGSGRSAPPAVAPPRIRRRPGLLAIGVALIALASLAAAYLTQVVGSTVPVVAIAQNMRAGEVLDRTDLRIANINADPALHPIGASQLNALIGKRAAVDLSAGSLLTDAAVTDRVLPGAGRSLVGIALTAAQLPAEPLRAGDRVRIVDTPGAQGGPPSATPATIAAEVVSTVGPNDTGMTIVNVTVDAGRAADLAARVATGRVALVLDSRER
jgi:hypothetical protein